MGIKSSSRSHARTPPVERECIEYYPKIKLTQTDQSAATIEPPMPRALSPDLSKTVDSYAKLSPRGTPSIGNPTEMMKRVDTLLTWAASGGSVKDTSKTMSSRATRVTSSAEDLLNTPLANPDTDKQGFAMNAGYELRPPENSTGGQKVKIASQWVGRFE